jgi:hypothetical protein
VPWKITRIGDVLLLDRFVGRGTRSTSLFPKPP